MSYQRHMQDVVIDLQAKTDRLRGALDAARLALGDNDPVDALNIIETHFLGRERRASERATGRIGHDPGCTAENRCCTDTGPGEEA